MANGLVEKMSVCVYVRVMECNECLLSTTTACDVD